MTGCEHQAVAVFAGGMAAAFFACIPMALAIRSIEKKRHRTLLVLRDAASEYMRRCHQDGGIFAAVALSDAIVEADEELKRSA